MNPAARWRFALAAALLLSWILLLPLLWQAFATVPSAERLQQSHMVRIPTLQTLWLQIGLSALELSVLLAVLWPLASRRYLARLWAAALGSTAYFLFTAPLSLTTLEWVHRRWLAAVALGLLLSALLASAGALLRRSRRR